MKSRYKTQLPTSNNLSKIAINKVLYKTNRLKLISKSWWSRRVSKLWVNEKKVSSIKSRAFSHNHSLKILRKQKVHLIIISSKSNNPSRLFLNLTPSLNITVTTTVRKRLLDYKKAHHIQLKKIKSKYKHPQEQRKHYKTT